MLEYYFLRGRIVSLRRLGIVPGLSACSAHISPRNFFFSTHPVIAHFSSLRNSLGTVASVPQFAWFNREPTPCSEFPIRYGELIFLASLTSPRPLTLTPVTPWFHHVPAPHNLDRDPLINKRPHQMSEVQAVSPTCGLPNSWSAPPYTFPRQNQCHLYYLPKAGHWFHYTV